MPAPTRQDNLPVAVSAIVVAVFSLSLGDALIKFASSDFVLWQIFVLRSALVLPVLIGFLWARARTALNVPPEIFWVILRSTLMVTMWVAYYVALPRIDLSLAAAAYYTAPIFITLFSALLLNDKISTLGWCAVILGFAGVILILRPNAGDFNAYALMPVASAVLYALAMIVTRAKCREVHPIYLAIGLNTAFVVVGLIAAITISLSGLAPREGFLLGEWAPLTGPASIALGILATVALIGSVGAAIAYQNGPPAVVGIFDFSYVGFAVLWGALFFAEVPDAIALTGMGMIIAAGILSVRR